MKIFDADGKVNFVDEKNTFVGFDMDQQCCEHFGWFLSRTVPASRADEPAEKLDPEGYNFDTGFFQSTPASGDECDCGGMVTFRLTKPGADSPNLFLTFYNSHNGYYSHGFAMEVGGTMVQEGSL